MVVVFVVIGYLQEQCRSSADAVRNYLAFRVALDEVARDEEGVTDMNMSGSW